MSVNEREIALDMLLKMEQGALSSKVLKEGLDNLLYLEKQNRAFISRLVEGSTEKRYYLDYVINLFSNTSTKKMKSLILSLLRLSVYQLLFMDRVPDSAAINEAVKLAKKRGFTSLSGFVNGVLRNISRKKETIVLPDPAENRVEYLSIFYSMPEFLIRRFFKDYGEETEAILSSFDQERTLTVRMNQNKTNRDLLLACFEKEGIKAKTSILSQAIRLSSYDSLVFSESFEEGLYFVQDESSQLVTELSGVKDGEVVIDLCAAPGGKSIAMALEIGEKGKVFSYDLTDYKLSLIEENVERMGLKNIEVGKNDASIFREDWKEKADILLCDLPCSGLGVMGRKRDIKYKLTEEKIGELVSLQRKILSNAVQYVKPGGSLLFSTCTMTKEENEDNFRFLAEELHLLPVDFSKELPEGFQKLSAGERYTKEAKQGYLRILPQDFGSDGFFISKFRRKK